MATMTDPGQAPTTMFPPPAPRVPRDTIHGVAPFSTPYKSPLTTRLAVERAMGPLSCLSSVNCSYLSAAVAPNLLQLKQHAQSLAVLIQEITVSHRPAAIDGRGKKVTPAERFEENESFDWLNDLSTRYTSDDDHHLQPLTSILNSVEEDPTSHETRHICPLQEVVELGDKIQSHPWATHQNLIRHANELLERLDHEYGARGGLLSIFPTDMQTEDREKAGKTVLGQMIFWVQNLVQRIHHLERLYANSMDILAREAIVPTETLSALGARGRKGREVVYPQDRFVMVNAGDDVWDFLNAEFERKEVVDTAVDKNYRDMGATGEAIWAERGGREFAKGITAIDVYTRYYRLRDSPLRTVFVIPAHEIHPGTKVTREMEQQPTVVSVVKPVWPERLSVIEQKHKDDMLELKQSRHQLNYELQKTAMQEQENHMLNDNNSKLREERRLLTQEKNRVESLLKEPVNKSKLDLYAEFTKASGMRDEAARARAVYERETAGATTAKAEADANAKAMKEAREAQMSNFKKLSDEREKEWEVRKKLLEDKDKDIGRAAQEAIAALKKAWLAQMTESQILIDFVGDTAVQQRLQDMTIPDHVMTSGKDKAIKLMAELDKQIANVVQSATSSAASPEKALMTAAPQTAAWRPERMSPGKQVSFPSDLVAGPSGKRKPEDQYLESARKRQQTAGYESL